MTRLLNSAISVIYSEPCVFAYFERIVTTVRILNEIQWLSKCIDCTYLFLSSYERAYRIL